MKTIWMGHGVAYATYPVEKCIEKQYPLKEPKPHGKTIVHWPWFTVDYNSGVTFLSLKKILKTMF